MDSTINLSYIVPCFITEESKPSKSRLAGQKKISYDLSTINPPNYSIQNIDDRIRIIFFSRNGRRNALGLSFMGLPFFCAGIFMTISLWKKSFLFLIFASIVPVVFTLIGGFLLVWGILSAFQKVELIIEDRQIIINKNYFLTSTQKKIDMDSIIDLYPKMSMQVGEKIWYNLALNVGKKLPIQIESLAPNKKDLDWIIEQINYRRKKSAS